MRGLSIRCTRFREAMCGRRLRLALAALVVPVMMAANAHAQAATGAPAAADYARLSAGKTVASTSFRIDGDGILSPLGDEDGDATRGRALIVARGAANCLNCHALPDATPPFFGTVGPSLAGVGSRLSVAQLRLRIVDITRVRPDAAMPSYYRVLGLRRVASVYRGASILDAGQVEDVVAYLAGLK